MSPTDTDPFSSAHCKGLPPRAYREWNRAQPCSVPMCPSNRDSTGSYCRTHLRRLGSHGHVSKGSIAPEDIYVAKRRIRKILEASTEAQHPQALAGIEKVHRLLHSPDSPIHQGKSQHEYLRRLASSRADPKEIAIETAAVLLCLYRNDPDGYSDPAYLAAQISRRLVKLAPRKYQNGGEGRSMKRNKAIAGAVLDAVGPLCTLLVATVERNRRLRQQKRRPAINKEHNAA